MVCELVRAIRSPSAIGEIRSIKCHDIQRNLGNTIWHADRGRKIARSESGDGSTARGNVDDFWMRRLEQQRQEKCGHEADRRDIRVQDLIVYLTEV